MPRNMVNSLSALLDPSGPTSSPSDESALSFHFFVILYLVALVGRNLSGDSVSGHLPGFSAVTCSDAGSPSGEWSSKLYF